MFRSLMICLAALAADGASDTPEYQVGNYVVVVQETALVVDGSPQKTVPIGTIILVEEIENGMLGVTAGRKGWIEPIGVATPERAIEKLTRLLAKEPDSAVIHRARANAAMMTREWDIVIADLAELIRLEPDESSNFYVRAQIWAEKQDPDKAIADWDEYLRREPNEAGALLVRGHLWASSKGDYDKGITDLTAAIDQIGRASCRERV